MTPNSTATFAYRALTASGARSAGTIEAATEQVASAKLREQGLFAVDLSPQHTAGIRKRRLSAGDLALGLSLLADLLESGLAASRALAAWQEVAPTAWHDAIGSIREEVRQGRQLSLAMRASAVDFPPLVTGLIQAGEAGGSLPGSVRQAARVSEEAASARAALRNALAYPAFLAFTGTISVALMVGVVLPRFAAMLADSGQRLPGSTRLLLALGSTVHRLLVPGAALLVASAFLGRTWIRGEAARQRVAEALLRMPLVGQIRCAMTTANFSGALSALLDNGVPLSVAVPHAANAAGDRAIAERARRARNDVLHGAPLSSALEQHHVTTATTARLVRAGEQNGRLAAMLAHAASLEHTRAQSLMAAAVRMIEPALVVLLGGSIGFIAAALLQAVYSIRPGT